MISNSESRRMEGEGALAVETGCGASRVSRRDVTISDELCWVYRESGGGAGVRRLDDTLKSTGLTGFMFLVVSSSCYHRVHKYRLLCQFFFILT